MFSPGMVPEAVSREQGAGRPVNVGTFLYYLFKMLNQRP